MPLDERGWEIPDPTPVAKPLRWNRPGSTLDQIRANLDQRMALLNREMEARGHETLEESQDFDVGDDMEPVSLHELRATAADLSPEQLFEAVFKKPYIPPAPLESGTLNPGVYGIQPGNPPIGPAGNSSSVANPPVPSSEKGGK